jgi:hypothetical protein
MYSRPVSDPDPKCEGAFQLTVTCSLPATRELEEGKEGARGKESTIGDARDGCELPITFLALTLNSYSFPAVSPVTVADVEVEIPSLNVVQVPEVATLYSTM